MSTEFVFYCVLFLPFKEDINAMEMEDDKRDLISREISKFRDTHKVKAAVITLSFTFWRRNPPHLYVENSSTANGAAKYMYA